MDDIDFTAIDPTWSTTKRGTSFLRKHDDNYGITIFATEEQIQLLSERRFLVADGTFKTAPEPYQQIYSFHGIVGNRRIPLLFALMQNRAAADYTRLLQLINRYVSRITNINNNFSPDMVVTDYELGFINALPNVLPNTQHRGCLFHFDKAVFKKVKEYGLLLDYRNNNRVTKYVRKIMALPFLPILLLRNSYNLHKQRHRRLIRRFPALARLNLYVEQTWLNGPFPLPLWNVYNRPLRLRTSDACEGWHHRWNTRVARVHPNVWYLLIALKREEVVIHRAIRNYRRNRRPQPQRRAYRLLNERIQQLKTEYTRNVKTLDEYWDAIEYACHRF